MTAEEVIFWYQAGLNSVLVAAAGPLLAVFVWRWARNLIGM